MRRRIVVDAHRTIDTNLRRHRIRHRLARREVEIRRVRTRHPARIHRRVPTSQTPRRGHIQRHRPRIARHTTTIRNHHRRRHTSTSQPEFGELPVDGRARLDGHGNERSGESECGREPGESAGARGEDRQVDRSLSMRCHLGVDRHAQPPPRDSRAKPSRIRNNRHIPGSSSAPRRTGSEPEAAASDVSIAAGV